MSGKTGGNRGPRRTAALAVATAVAVLSTACGFVHVHLGSSGGSAPTGPAAYREELAYAQCMRAHGLPGFPDPHPSGGPSAHVNVNPNSSAARANDACKHLLAAGSTGTAATAPAPSPPGAVSADCLASRPRCYTPHQLRVAYGIQPLLDRGITGCGQTVVLPEFPPSAAGSPPAVTDIRQDLARLDALFGLPAVRLQVVNTLAHAASPWLASTEQVGDTEVAHAPGPGAVIREVLIPSSYTVAGVALSIRQDTRRRDRATGQLEAGS